MTEIIGPNQVKKGTLATYSALPDTAKKFRWTVGGGKILKGQGTHQIEVDWAFAGPGSLELDVTTEEGDIDAIFICIDVHKTENEQSKKDTQVRQMTSMK